MFDIELEPHEQEISIPKLVERVVSPAFRKVSKPASTLRELVYELADEEKNAAAKQAYRSKVEKLISDDISNGRLSVAKLGNREIVLLPSLVQWVFSYEKDVRQSGIDGRESYAAVAKRELFKQSEKIVPPRALPRLRQQELEILDWLKSSGYDAQNLPARELGFGTPKALARKALDGTSSFEGRTTFGKAWERLRAGKEIKEE